MYFDEKENKLGARKGQPSTSSKFKHKRVVHSPGLKCPASMHFKLTDLIKVWLKSLNVAKIFLGFVINGFKKFGESWINLDRVETVGPSAIVSF